MADGHQIRSISLSEQDCSTLLDQRLGRMPLLLIDLKYVLRAFGCLNQRTDPRTRMYARRPRAGGDYTVEAGHQQEIKTSVRPHLQRIGPRHRPTLGELPGARADRTPSNKNMSPLLFTGSSALQQATSENATASYALRFSGFRSFSYCWPSLRAHGECCSNGAWVPSHQALGWKKQQAFSLFVNVPKTFAKSGSR